MEGYVLNNTEEVISPSLIYDLDIIRRNTEEIIRIAGGPERLWPHIKTHKCIKMVELLMSYGIRRFKAATIAEAEMAAMAGAERVILAYPLIGPNQKRLIELAKGFPKTTFYAMEDDLGQMRLLSELCGRMDYELACLVDVNTGLDRTGVPMERVEAFYRESAALPHLRLEGLHCYDGDRHEREFAARNQKVVETDALIAAIVSNLRRDGYACDIVVAGGTPSFPCHAKDDAWYLSPGTSFIHDAGYRDGIPDLNCTPGAAVMTRVVSHPAPGCFTLDLGYKGIASDPSGQRGWICGYEDAESVMQNEEHWVWRLKDEDRIPPIGTCLYVIPAHICPTSALYPEVLIAQKGEVTDHWQVTARNRRITY